MTAGVPEEEPEMQKQQADVVAFGQRAAEGAELEELLGDAAREVATSLGVRYVKVLEYQPDEKTLLVRAGCGWGEGVVGEARVGAEVESPAGYALQTAQPVIANDLDREERFRIPKLLSDHDVKSAVNVIIKNRSNVYGVLEADSREPRAFDDADARFLQGYANILSFVIEQNRLVEQNLKFARLQETFFEELQHRIRNNNQQLLSLINLQLSDTTSIETRDHLMKIASRILALSRVNEQLTSGRSPDRVDLGQYLLAVVASLFDFHRDSATNVRLESEICQIEFGTRDAQAVGLVVNEFLTNSFKHAFPGDGGTFRIVLEHREGGVCLRLQDDGVGYGQDIKIGLGLKLIEALSRQLEASVRWSTEAGAMLEMTLPRGSSHR